MNNLKNTIEIPKNMQDTSCIKIAIENFRNLGYNPDPDRNKIDKQVFLLSRSTNKNHSGDLNILLGKNNSGKSNILAAITLLNEPLNYTKNDIPRNLVVEGNKDNNLVPNIYILGNENHLEFNISNAIKFIKDKINDLKNRLSNPNKTNLYYYSNWNDKLINNGKNDLFKLDINNIRNELNKLPKDKKVYLQVSNKNWEEEIKNLSVFSEIENLEEIKQYNLCKIKEILKSLYSVINLCNLTDVFAYLLNSYDWQIFGAWLKDTKIEKEIDNYLKKIDNFEKNKSENAYDINQIHIDINGYKQTDFSVEYNKKEIEQNKFFINLIKLTDLNIDELLLNIKEENSNDPWLSHANKKLQKINEEFNKIFSLSNETNKYIFTLSLDKKLRFGIHLQLENGDKLNKIYEQQSTGFKWFFNFFFKVWNKIVKNDNKQKIILLDEPGNGLSSNALIELRNFLKKIAYKYNIIFVLTTHRSEWIDLDYLEELRLISMDNAKAKIHNNFNFEENKNEIWLLNLLGKVETNLSNIHSYHDLDDYDDTKNIFFVDTIIDYLYLTAIKIYLLNNNQNDQNQIKKLKYIYFLPINGVQNIKEDFENKFVKLQKILKANTFKFIVNNDQAGLDFKKLVNSDSLVKTLNDIIDKKDVNKILDLINKEDIQKFNLINENNEKSIN